MNTNPPHRLGRYQLLERIAVGGMAEVYKAISRGLSGFEKTVVVKRLLPQHQRDQELLTMFVDEARLLGRMHHDNIAEVYDIDHEGDEYFFALEYVDGVDVRVLLDERVGQPLPLGEALWIAVQLGRALAYAHALTDENGKPLGIVHRDISPSNVIVDRKGAVKLVDFGVAKWLSQRSETRHGVLKGKVSYMSPEQCKGEALDHRSDVFALGVLLYEMTVGHKPFSSESDFQTLKAIAEGHHLPPSQRLANYPAVLEAIVESALALQREERMPNMSQLVDQLMQFAEAGGLSLGPSDLALRVQRICALRPQAWVGASVGLEDLSVASRLERTATVAAVPAPVNDAPLASASSMRRWVWPAALAATLLITAALWLLQRPPAPKVSGHQTTGVNEPASSPAHEPLAPPPIRGEAAIGKSEVQAHDLTASPSHGASTPSSKPKQGRPQNITRSKSGAVVKENPRESSLWDPDSPVPP